MKTPSERLLDAIGANDLALVRSLIDADPSLLKAILRPGRSRDYRALTEAAVYGQVPVLKYFISQGCDVREDQNYPMFRACLYDRCLPAVEVLVEHGADVNGVWADYGPPIISSCEGMAPAVMRWLLAHGAVVAGSARGATRQVSWNALVHAAGFGKECPELLAILLESGADVNGRDAKGRTALHIAARRGDVRGVELLLGKGARRGLKDGTGRSPSDVTRNRGVARMLRSR